MTAKEILNKIKAAFDGPDVAPGDVQPADTTEPGTNATGTNVISYAVDGAQPVYVDISDDGIADIDPDDAVYADEALTTPYPDGTYNITGTTFGFTVGGGLVASISDPAGTGAGTPIEDATDPVTTDMTTAPVAPVAPAQLSVEERLAAVEEELAKIKKPAVPTAAETQLQATSQKFEAQVKKHEETIKDLFGLVEKLCELPTADPVTLTGNKKDKFDRINAKEKKIEGIAAAIKEMKSK
jgi:hypothetical protein